MLPMATYRSSLSHALSQCRAQLQADNMGKGFYISKTVGIVAIIVGAGALATIIALSVVYSQEKTKNNQVSPTDGQTTSKPPVTTPTPSNEPWDKYRLPTSLVPDHYNVTLWPRLTPDSTGLYIFTGKAFHVSDPLKPVAFTWYPEPK